MKLPLCDLSTPAGRRLFQKKLAALRATASLSSPAAKTTAAIVEDVRRRGDPALIHYMRRFTNPAFGKRLPIRVAPRQIALAEKSLDPSLRRALLAAIRNVTAYQRHIMPRPTRETTIAGARLGLRFTPVDSAGLLVPGGRAAYPSTLIMLAVPALVAGVPPEKISVVTPPPTASGGGGDVSPLVLAAAHLLGIDTVYRIGGAQAVAALAFGTRSVKPVDLIAGPGNIFVQLAKTMVSGAVGTDNGFYGPSEIVTIADASARPDFVASDLLAQAEHDPGKCFLISWSRPVIDHINNEISRQLQRLPRAPAIVSSFRTHSAAVLCRDAAHAAEIANTLAAEHVSLAVKSPRAWLKKIRHAGEFFLGHHSPVAAGDYLAGPSHCLPTATTARFASGVSAYTFLKRTGTIEYPRNLPPNIAKKIARLANAETLTAHAASARIRIS